MKFEWNIDNWCLRKTSPDVTIYYWQATGTLCDGGEGYCHSGRCGSLGGQCRLLWGEQARVAHSSCFSLNRRGDTRGNCGYKDTNRTHLRSCSQEDIMCGLLHCQVTNDLFLYPKIKKAYLRIVYLSIRSEIILVISLGLVWRILPSCPQVCCLTKQRMSLLAGWIKKHRNRIWHKLSWTYNKKHINKQFSISNYSNMSINFLVNFINKKKIKE